MLGKIICEKETAGPASKHNAPTPDRGRAAEPVGEGPSRVRPGREQSGWGPPPGAHLVEDEADGEQLGPLGPRLPPVLLHQGDQAGADEFILL